MKNSPVLANSAWNSLVGHTWAVDLLRGALVHDRVGHSYLFTGPEHIGKTTLARLLSQALKDSIAWAHAHVDEALEYAMRYGRGIDKETCRRFVLMYVNDFTLALGPDGRAAIERLFTLAHQKGLIPAVPPIDPV